MGFNLGRTGRPSILAVVYSDGAAACRMISDLGYRLRDAGVAIAGIVPYHATRDGTPRCDMEVEELASRIILQLAEDQTPQSTGCRVDPAAMQDAAALIASAFQKCPELLIVNKFGKLEADGGGLGDVITEAVESRHSGRGRRSGATHRALARIHQRPRRRSDDRFAARAAMAGAARPGGSAPCAPIVEQPLNSAA